MMSPWEFGDVPFLHCQQLEAPGHSNFPNCQTEANCQLSNRGGWNASAQNGPSCQLST